MTFRESFHKEIESLACTIFSDGLQPILRAGGLEPTRGRKERAERQSIEMD